VWRGKKDGMIAECQRADAETRRQRDTALARRGSDYADRLTAAVRDGRPGYRCFRVEICRSAIDPRAAAKATNTGRWHRPASPFRLWLRLAENGRAALPL